MNSGASLLDTLVAETLGWKQVMWGDRAVWVQADGEGRFQCNVADWKPSTDWAQGGPLIEREGITVISPFPEIDEHEWTAANADESLSRIDATPLIAAMRCFVDSKFGEEVPSTQEVK